MQFLLRFANLRLLGQKFRSNQYIYIYIYGFNGNSWRAGTCGDSRAKRRRAKCNLDYHSNEDLCTGSACANGCDSLENCLRCWCWKFMRITSAGDAEVTARARASPRPKPFVADENYTLETALLSMTPRFIYIYISLSLSFYIPSSLYRRERKNPVRWNASRERKSFTRSCDFFPRLFSTQDLFILAIMSLYCLLRSFT